MPLPTTALQFPDISKTPLSFVEADIDFEGLANYFRALGYSDTVSGVQGSVADFVTRVMRERYDERDTFGLSVSGRPPVYGEDPCGAKFQISITDNIFFRKWKPEIAEDPELVGYLLCYMQSLTMSFLFSIENSTSAEELITCDHLYGCDTKEEALEQDPDRDPADVHSVVEIKEMLDSTFSKNKCSPDEAEPHLARFGITPGLHAELAAVAAVAASSAYDGDDFPHMDIYIADDYPNSIETEWVEGCEQACMQSYGVGFTTCFKTAHSADPLEGLFELDQMCSAINKGCREISNLIYKTTDWAFD